jgi:hypothetical protein
MTKRNAAAVIVDDLPFDTPAGHTLFHRDAGGIVIGLTFGCPCGCGAHHGARFTGPDAWGFDGNIEKPTVSGSFGCHPSHRSPVGPDGHYHWHGHLRAGVYEEC